MMNPALAAVPTCRRVSLLGSDLRTAAPAQSVPELGPGPSTQWSTEVAVQLQAHYPDGSAERHAFRLLPPASEGVVSVLDRTARRMAPALRVEWRSLPGATICERVIAVLAVAVFGDIALPPRITGAPLWREASLYSVDLSRRCVLTEIDIQVTGPCTALMRYRSDGPPPFALWGTVPLHRYDADPLRAVLRLALHVRSLSLVPELARRGSAAAAAKAWLTPPPECLPAGPAQVTAPAP